LKTRLTVAFALVCWAVVLGAAGLTEEIAVESIKLTEESKSPWQVFLPPQAGIVERFACDELKKYVERMSGAKLADADRSDKPRTIRLGLRKDLGAGDDLPDPKPGHDGYSMSVSTDSIVIAGDNPRGVLYGVYDLLERLGCRWYHPTLDPKDPEVVPKNPSLSLPVGKWSASARIEDRVYWISSLAFKIVPEHAIPQLDWAAKNRFNTLSWQCVVELIDQHLEEMNTGGIFDEMAKRGLVLHGPGHSFPYFLSTEKYFEKHPEWFGFRDGKRQPHGGVWPATNYCMSNAEANEEFIQNVEAFVKKYPQIERLDLLPIDGGWPCECEQCLKSTPTDLLVDLFNKLSDRLEKIAPDVILDAVPGYGQMEQPPRNVFPNGKWQGLYAHWGRNHAESYSDPQYGRRANMLIWGSYFKRFWICSYYAAASHNPFTGPPFLHAIEGDTKYMVEHGVTGALVLEYPFGFWWSNSFNIRLGALYPYYYPKRDPRSELRDYALRYYGPKAGPLLAEYYEMIGSNENLEKTYRAGRGEAEDWDLIWLKEMRAMISRAAQLAADDPVHSYRISKLADATDMLIRLGSSRLKIVEIEKVVADCEADKEEVKKKISDARAMIADLLSHAEKLAAADNGIMDGDEFGGWIIGRTFTGALDRAERALRGAEAKGKE